MWLLTKCLLFWCMLQSMLFWPTNFYSRPWLLILAALVLLIFNSKKWFATNIPIIGLFLAALLLIADSIIINGFIPSIAIAVTYFTGICLFRLKDDRKKDLLRFVTKWFGIIIGISLGWYIIWLPIRFAPFGILENPFGYYNVYNFIFFVIPNTTTLITRFSGPFIEPGHLGMIAVFIIYANKFNFKHNRYLWVILAAVLFSLSLAGYVLLALAYLLHRGMGLKQILWGTVIAIGILYSVTNLWNNGDNPVNQKIVERLYYDEEKGISGNNRNLYSTELYFAKMIGDGRIIWGLGNEQYTFLQKKKIIGGAGVTVYLIYNGIIGLILVFIYYAIIAWLGIDRKYSIGFLLLICFCFIQRAYPFWMAWLVPYITSIYTQYKSTVSKQKYENRLYS